MNLYLQIEPVPHNWNFPSKGGIFTEKQIRQGLSPRDLLPENFAKYFEPVPGPPDCSNMETLVGLVEKTVAIIAWLNSPIAQSLRWSRSGRWVVRRLDKLNQSAVRLGMTDDVNIMPQKPTSAILALNKLLAWARAAIEPPAPPAPAQPTAAPDTVGAVEPVSDTAFTILQQLDRDFPVLVKIVDLAPAIGSSETATSEAVQKLEIDGLVSRPRGKRSGFTRTKAGRDVLAARKTAETTLKGP